MVLPPPPWFILQDLFETILYAICLGNSFLVELFMFYSLYNIIADSVSWIWFFWSINQPDCTLSVCILLSQICIWIYNCLMVSRYEESKILGEDIKATNQNPTTMPIKTDTTPLTLAVCPVICQILSSHSSHRRIFKEHPPPSPTPSQLPPSPQTSPTYSASPTSPSSPTPTASPTSHTSPAFPTSSTSPSSQIQTYEIYHYSP